MTEPWGSWAEPAQGVPEGTPELGGSKHREWFLLLHAVIKETSVGIGECAQSASDRQRLTGLSDTCALIRECNHLGLIIIAAFMFIIAPH